MGDLFDTLLGPLLAREGGYSNDASDPGGETNFGVTAAVARACGYAGPIANLTRGQAVEIYRGRYWSGPGFDKVAPLSAAIASELLDTGINMGPDAAVTFLQRSLNALNTSGLPDLKTDGALGPLTLATLKAFLARRAQSGVVMLLKALNCLQGAHYVEIAEARVASRVFTFGWFNQRIDLG